MGYIYAVAHVVGHVVAGDARQRAAPFIKAYRMSITAAAKPPEQ